MKIPFFIEKKLNKLLKPQIVSIVETFINEKKSQKFFGKSLTANFLQMIFFNWSNGNNIDFDSSNWGGVINTNAAVGRRATTGLQAISSSNQRYSIQAPSFNDLYGIVLGSGIGAISPVDFDVITKINNGNLAGQLEYQVQTAPQGVRVLGAQSNFIIDRIFVNNSGGNVNVNNIGIYANSGGVYYLQYIDSLGVTDVIPNTLSYRVRITFEITT